MRAVKKRVALRDIRPSGTNPREDMGDIAALAASINATGGEPVNPPILVEDGNVYRIVDGERRYRALCSIYGKGSEVPVQALVAEGMSDAEEAVAMVATDDKRPLTEAELARGVQQMMVLGVDEERAALAARTTRERVRAAKALSAEVPKGCQVTLEQMEAALALPEGRREEVLSAGEAWRGVAGRISREIEREANLEADTAAWEAAGVGVTDEVPEGVAHLDWVCLGEAGEWIAGHAPLEEGTLAVLTGSYWNVKAPYAEEEVSPEEAERELLGKRRADALRELMADAAELVVANDFGVPPDFLDEVRSARSAPYVHWDVAELLAGRAGEKDVRAYQNELSRTFMDGVSQGSDPSRYECGFLLLDRIASAVCADLCTARGAGKAIALVRLLERCGLDIGEQGTWLLGSLEEELDEKGGGDDGE